MEVLFEITGSWFPLRERAATTLAEDLRRKAAGQLGELGTEGALAAADAAARAEQSRAVARRARRRLLAGRPWAGDGRSKPG
jgi:hypothetical protein